MCSQLGIVTALALAAALLCTQADGVDAGKWLDRVIPLPKEIEVLGSVMVPAGQINLSWDVEGAPAFSTAAELMHSFALGTVGSSFTIQLSLLDAVESESAQRQKTRLATLPNRQQAYAIMPLDYKSGLLLLANTDQGLLYAARTLVQLIRPPQDIDVGTHLEIPLVKITDWPDLAERGQWGGNTADDLPWTSQWKLNVLEASTKDEALVRRGAELGVKVVPMIVHLEQLPIPPEFRDRKDMRRLPDPSKPLPSDYRASLCMSSSGTGELIGNWLEEFARMDGVTDIMVWLSEGATPCFCERCLGKEPYELEVACVLRAFEKAKARNPKARLRLLTTQGSFPVNDRILAMVPENVGVSYYDGGRAYSSDRVPMIYPLLEEYAESGRWLGVYPQITHCWRTVFPWTAPQFIRFRAQEFVDKKLKCMIGYAVPSNRYHEFNVMAVAEWTWNSHGRSPEEFCRAYATVAGVCDPDLFARWAVNTGEAGWSLAESKLLLRLVYDPAIGFEGKRPFDHRFQAAEISNIDKSDKAIGKARRALTLARKAGNRDMIDESECVLAGLQAFKSLRLISRELTASSLGREGRQSLGKALVVLDRCAHAMRSHILGWGNRICAETGGKLPTRLLDTATVLFRTCDAVREAAAHLGVRDPSPEYRLRRLGEWSAENFIGGQCAAIRFDLSSFVPAHGGSCHVGFDFIDSAYGTDIKKITIVTEGGGEEETVAETPDQLKRVSRWERWCEMRIEIPERRPDDSLFLEIELCGLPPDAPEGRRTCSGSVGIRRIPQPPKSGTEA